MFHSTPVWAVGCVWPNRAADFRGPPLWTPKIGFHFATHCRADQRVRNAATKCVLRAYSAAKCDCSRGRAVPRTPLGELTALVQSPDPLAGLRGTLRGGDGEREGKEGQGQGGGERRLPLMRSWNRAADWLRPALLGCTFVIFTSC